MAAASDVNSQSLQSGSRSHSSRSGQAGSSAAVSSIDAARAAELDLLVDAGDWEGVVLAAAKFEVLEDGSKGSSASVSVKSGSNHQRIEIDWREYRCGFVWWTVLPPPFQTVKVPASNKSVLKFVLKWRNLYVVSYRKRLTILMK